MMQRIIIGLVVVLILAGCTPEPEVKEFSFQIAGYGGYTIRDEARSEMSLTGNTLLYVTKNPEGEVTYSGSREVSEEELASLKTFFAQSGFFRFKNTYKPRHGGPEDASDFEMAITIDGRTNTVLIESYPSESPQKVRAVSEKFFSLEREMRKEQLAQRQAQYAQE